MLQKRFHASVKLQHFFVFLAARVTIAWAVLKNRYFRPCYTLEIVDSVKYLGITISSDLSWTKHINIISSKARKLVGLLFRQFYRCADADTIRKIYIAIVRSHLEYASQIWDLHLLKDQQTLENIQKFACRVCLKQWDLSYPTLLRTLSIPTLAARRKQLKLCTFFTVM